MYREDKCPYPQVKKVGEIILYILDKLGTVDEGVLKNILYFIEFDFYEKHEEHVMGLTYIKDES